MARKPRGSQSSRAVAVASRLAITHAATAPGGRPRAGAPTTDKGPTGEVHSTTTGPSHAFASSKRRDLPGYAVCDAQELLRSHRSLAGCLRSRASV